MFSKIIYSKLGRFVIKAGYQIQTQKHAEQESNIINAKF